jgi:hypothetical protein
VDVHSGLVDVGGLQVPVEAGADFFSGRFLATTVERIVPA